MENFQGSYIYFIYITVVKTTSIFENGFFICNIYSLPQRLLPSQITTYDQFRSYSKSIFSQIVQVRDELCLAHEAFQFFRKFNQNPMIRKNALDIFFQAEIPISLWRGQSITNHLQRMKEEDSRLTSIANPTLHFNSIIRHNQYTLMPVHVLAGPGCQKASSLHLALVSLLMYYFVASPPYLFVWLQPQ